MGILYYMRVKDQLTIRRGLRDVNDALSITQSWIDYEEDNMTILPVTV